MQEGIRIVCGGHPRPLGPAFACRLRRAMMILTGFAIAGFTVASHTMLVASQRHWLREQALLCAAALSPGSNGDLSASFASLHEGFDRLVAVGTLDPTGNLVHAYPRRPAHRAALVSALKSPQSATMMPSAADGESVRLSGAVVPLYGAQSRDVQRAVFLFRDELRLTAWLQTLLLFVAILATAGVFTVRALNVWFDRKIIRPLCDVAGAVRATMEGSRRVATVTSGEWCETIEIAKLFDGLVRNVAQGKDCVRRTERDLQDEFRRKEAGLGCQLRRAKDQATLDPLTKLRNRSFLEEELEPLFDRHRSQSRDLAAVMIDLDNFKRYNDGYGHQAGDALLRFVGALVRGGIRPEDYGVRYGGDEFLLLLPDTSAEGAAIVANRLVKLFGQYAKRLGRRHRLSMSAGLASLNRELPTDGHVLVAQADRALYAAKRNGKNTVADSANPDAPNRSPGPASARPRDAVTPTPA